MKQLLLAIIPLLLVATVSNVYAGGPRLDYPEDGTGDSDDCWVYGYDAGFAGKYDSNRAKEGLQNEGDQYNASWDGACLNGDRTEVECDDIMNNPILFKAVFNSSLHPISFSRLFLKLPVIPYQYFVTRYQTFSMPHVFPQQCPCKQPPLIWHGPTHILHLSL
jgi:hypothetical protein